jgi:mRNA-degrading endonuclease YafQ of YafQ-DinJ toxin-antitoxin module
VIKYKLYHTKEFRRSVSRLTKKNQHLIDRIEKTLSIIQKYPFSKGLKTHKVLTRKYGRTYSSRVTGNLRLIWNFDKEKKLIVILITIGGHSGKHKVYK